MSALPPKADILSVEIDVCFVPEADTHPGTEAGRVGLSLIKRAQLTLGRRGI